MVDFGHGSGQSAHVKLPLFLSQNTVMYKPSRRNSTVEEITEKTFGLHRHAVKCNLALLQWQYMINIAINSSCFSPVYPDTKLSET